MEILVTIGYIALCVALFSLAIFIHELGHFLVALKLGLRVEAFSIGFGRPLWKRRYRGVEYRIGPIPLGGYVSIPDVDPEGTKTLEGGGSADAAERVRIPAWKEIAVAFAGPAMNVVLAVVLAFALSCVPQAKFGELSARIGTVLEGGPAAAAGMLVGDLVVSVGGRETRTWTDLQTEVQISGGRETEFVVERGEEGKRVTLKIVAERDPVTGAWLIKAASERNESGAVAWMPDRSPLKQLAWDAGSIFRILRGLVTPKDAKATSAALGGPVMIAEGLYRQVRRNFWDGMGFLRFLNVNLAILNLLPIPVLDGGLILFSLFALVFRRRVPDAIVGRISMVFMVLLVAAMGLLIVRDSWRSYKIHSHRGNVHEAADKSAEGR